MSQRARRRRKVETLLPTEDELAQRVLGPHHEALAVVHGDAVLADQLQDYIDAGGAVIALGDVPRYRRPAVVEEALSAWQAARTGGPCRICGAVAARGGPFRDQTCGWCFMYLSEGQSEQGLLSKVFSLVVGIAFDVHDRVLAFHEIPGAGDGTAWSHLPVEALRADVAADPSYQHFTTGAHAWRAANQLPGLPEQYLWPVAPERPKTAMPAPEATPAQVYAREGAVIRREHEQAHAELRRAEQGEDVDLDAARRRAIAASTALQRHNLAASRV